MQSSGGASCKKNNLDSGIRGMLIGISCMWHACILAKLIFLIWSSSNLETGNTGGLDLLTEKANLRFHFRLRGNLSWNE